MIQVGKDNSEQWLIVNVETRSNGYQDSEQRDNDSENIVYEPADSEDIDEGKTLTSNRFKLT